MPENLENKLELKLLDNPRVIAIARAAFEYAVMHDSSFGEFHEFIGEIDPSKKEVWVPVLAPTNPSKMPTGTPPVLIAYHFLCNSKKQALEYATGKQWKVSHAVKIWPKE